MIQPVEWLEHVAISHDSPAPESYKTSATESRGSARVEDKLVRSPSGYRASLEVDLVDCKDRELPKVLLICSFMGL